MLKIGINRLRPRRIDQLCVGQMRRFIKWGMQDGCTK